MGGIVKANETESGHGELTMDTDIGRMPTFFIVGAPRCGTTALYSYLRQHPDVFLPDNKEPHFFNTDMNSGGAIRDESEYLALFASARDQARIGEASVYY